MDTATAISTLQAMLTTLQSNVTGYQAQADAISLAISQLEGTLTTEVAADQATIAALQTEVAAQPAPVDTPAQTDTPSLQ